MATTIKIDFTSDSLLNSLGLGADNRAQKFFTKEVYRCADKYTPMRTGMLKNTAIIGEGYIEYNVPYARYMWHGEKYDDPIIQASGFQTADGWKSHKGVKKVASGIPLDYNGAPTRGARWIERAWVENKFELETSLLKFMTRGGRNG